MCESEGACECVSTVVPALPVTATFADLFVELTGDTEFVFALLFSDARLQCRCQVKLTTLRSDHSSGSAW